MGAWIERESGFIRFVLCMISRNALTDLSMNVGMSANLH